MCVFTRKYAHAPPHTYIHIMCPENLLVYVQVRNEPEPHRKKAATPRACQPPYGQVDGSQASLLDSSQVSCPVSYPFLSSSLPLFPSFFPRSLSLT
jgi:hypothetical protein